MTLADELRLAIEARKDHPTRVNPVCLNPHLARRILAALTEHTRTGAGQ
jgi:hypothetical protein